MKATLNKLFLFYSDAYRHQFAISHTLFFLIPMGLLFIINELVWWIAAIMIVINIAIFFLIRRDYPSSIEANEDSVCFTEYNQLGRAGYGVKAKITLKNIRRVKYEQSKLEKLFNIGRITLVADASFEITTGKLGNTKYPLSRSYSFYGVKKYSEVKKYFEKNYR
ncbi:MAG: hypothetical protein IKL36_02210 [Clostridia bacterium]|nr:hypothetical protein [Clostridia bacterium]